MRIRYTTLCDPSYATNIVWFTWLCEFRFENYYTQCSPPENRIGYVCHMRVSV